tara:strand:+ start:109 stop:315 length:207 start_codon:yes stop_codon:yes gene_type:complete
MKVHRKNGGHHKELTRRFKERLIDGKKLCYKCNVLREFDDYYPKQTQCKMCASKISKERNKRASYKLW